MNLSSYLLEFDQKYSAYLVKNKISLQLKFSDSRTILIKIPVGVNQEFCYALAVFGGIVNRTMRL